MANIVEVGAAVWVRSANGITEGVIANLGQQDASVLSNSACVTIALNGGHSVLATSISKRGNVWGLLEHDSPPAVA